MDCAFCTEFAALPHAGQSTRVICEASGWVLLPTVGCFAPGYCLFMPLGHIDAMADAAPDELAVAAGAVEHIRALISGVFGTVIVAEHGPRGCELGAACCSHAHLHLIPVPDVEEVAAAYRSTGGPGRRLQDLADLPGAVDGSYLYLSPRPGEHLLWPSAGFARQYVRRVCAAQHGVAGMFDWRDHPFDDNQALTITTLRAHLRSRQHDSHPKLSSVRDPAQRAY
jgi:diadenosine tetraphosphate (Ap4A) HIT family hydrolase